MHTNLRRHNNLYLLCIQILITHTPFNHAYSSLNTHINYTNLNCAYKSQLCIQILSPENKVLY